MEATGVVFLPRSPNGTILCGSGASHPATGRESAQLRSNSENLGVIDI